MDFDSLLLLSSLALLGALALFMACLLTPNP
jgi:hypothetical protein